MSRVRYWGEYRRDGRLTFFTGYDEDHMRLIRLDPAVTDIVVDGSNEQ